MNYFTKYAEQKFEILNRYKIFITKEMVEDCLEMPDEISEKGEYEYARKDELKVIYKMHGNIKKVITFFPC